MFVLLSNFCSWTVLHSFSTSDFTAFTAFKLLNLWTDPYRKRSTSFSVGLPRMASAFVSERSVLDDVICFANVFGLTEDSLLLTKNEEDNATCDSIISFQPLCKKRLGPELPIRHRVTNESSRFSFPVSSVYTRNAWDRNFQLGDIDQEEPNVIYDSSIPSEARVIKSVCGLCVNL